MSELIPCPFCPKFGVMIQENMPSPRMDGKRQEPISVDIVHHCDTGRNLPRRIIKITGRDMDQAITAWNTRIIQPAEPAIYNWLNAHIKIEDLKTHPEWKALKQLLGVQE